MIVHDLDDQERQDAYDADITYGTNNEFGFDYLRDNMKFRIEDCVQRGAPLRHRRRSGLDPDRRSAHAADHFRSQRGIHRQVLQDQPHHSQAGPRRSDRRQGAGREVHHRRLHRRRKAPDRRRSPKRACSRSRSCSASAICTTPTNIEINHHVQQALQGARAVPARQGLRGEGRRRRSIIVDEFTGRLMPGRRWSDGLHQAVEAKEGVKIQRENQTLATITFQNYFRMYKKLAGMTGTAETEAAEFEKIYNLDVTVIPTNRPMIRNENPDVVYRTEEEKFRNAAKEIKELNEKGQPVLVGTISVEKSERLSGILKKHGRPARSAERQESRARSVHRGAGRAQGRGHRLHQHGRPRHRHSAGRQSRVHDQGSAWKRKRRDKDTSRRAFILPHHDQFYRSARSGTRSSPDSRQQTDEEHDEVVGAGRPAHPGHRAARIAAHRQSASRTRRPPGRSRQLALLSSRCRTICCASSAASACRT